MTPWPWCPNNSWLSKHRQNRKNDLREILRGNESENKTLAPPQMQFLSWNMFFVAVCFVGVCRATNHSLLGCLSCAARIPFWSPKGERRQAHAPSANNSLLASAIADSAGDAVGNGGLASAVSQSGIRNACRHGLRRGGQLELRPLNGKGQCSKR